MAMSIIASLLDVMTVKDDCDERCWGGEKPPPWFHPGFLWMFFSLHLLLNTLGCSPWDFGVFQNTKKHSGFVKAKRLERLLHFFPQRKPSSDDTWQFFSPSSLNFDKRRNFVFSFFLNVLNDSAIPFFPRSQSTCLSAFFHEHSWLMNFLWTPE